MSTDKTTTKVEPQDPARKNSAISGPLEEESTVRMDQSANTCYWNDQAFEQGARVESEGTCYECSFGTWVPLGD